MIKEDETLMAVYPAIRAMPDSAKKEKYKRDMTQIVSDNADAILARRAEDKKR